MAAAKIEAMWDYDMHDNSILVLEKKRGKLSLNEVGDFLRYEKRGGFKGNYVLIIRATEATCGGSGWMDEEEPKGDQWVLYQVEQGEPCPVCSHMTPSIQWCESCGEPLNGEGPTKEQAFENAERLLATMRREATRMIHEASTYEGKMAWYHSHLGSLDFARQMGLITEERRQQLYKEFGKDRPEKPIQKIDRKIDLIKRMQTEMDHRAEVEEKAVQLITEGRHGEAVALLNSLDDSLIAGMQEEFEAIEAAGGGKEIE